MLAQHVYAITVTTDKSGKEIYSRIFHNKTETDFTDVEIPMKNWKMSLWKVLQGSTGRNLY